MKKNKGFLKYSNRKIYDQSKSKYVNLRDVLFAIVGRPELRVLEHKTGADITDEVLLSAAISIPVLRAKLLATAHQQMLQA